MLIIWHLHLTYVKPFEQNSFFWDHVGALFCTLSYCQWNVSLLLTCTFLKAFFYFFPLLKSVAVLPLFLSVLQTGSVTCTPPSLQKAFSQLVVIIFVRSTGRFESSRSCLLVGVVSFSVLRTLLSIPLAVIFFQFYKLYFIIRDADVFGIAVE